MKRCWLLIFFLLLVGCGTSERLADGEVHTKLVEFVNVTEENQLSYVIYNSEDKEVINSKDKGETKNEFLEAIEGIQMIYRKNHTDTEMKSYGLLEVGNSTDTIKTVHLIDESTIVIGDYTYDIIGGEALKLLVEGFDESDFK